MILVLGGTTEGRIAVRTLEEAGQPFYYSTKGNEQTIPLHHGKKVEGGMDAVGMEAFCRHHGIRVLVDAAHPFAELLHQTVKHVADVLALPVIRLERMYPEDISPSVAWCSDYDDAVRQIRAAHISKLLALTGVQSIRKLNMLWQQDICCCYFRILDRESSRRLAREQGFPMDRLCYYRSEDDNRPQFHQLHPEAVLLKESGVSGGFCQKVAAAEELGIRIFAIRRPKLPDSFICVDGEHGLRRMVEKLLPEFYPLHSGLTTGTCATAAAVAAVYRLWGHPTLAALPEVPVLLPDGETIQVPVVPQGAPDGTASVVKESGDDPDVTNGLTICARIECAPVLPEEIGGEYTVKLRGGKGVGRVTLPGLGLEIGAPAINDTPQRMIKENVVRALKRVNAPRCAHAYVVTVSVPQGEEVAHRTFNPRLGVVGGISIIGTSGIVKPFSSEAFVQSIRKSLEVACSTGSRYVVINSGAKSERFLHARYPELPVQAFVHYGNFIGETLQLCAELHVPRLVLGLMMGKAVKLAEGHLNTHSKAVVMNKTFIRELAVEAGCARATLCAIEQITLARELWQLLPDGELHVFCRLLLEHCYAHCRPLFPSGELKILLLSDEGAIFE